MKTEEAKRFIRWCILGAIGGVLMAAGDWLLGCIPLQETDAGMFNRAYYLSGGYGLWRPVLIVGPSIWKVGAVVYPARCSMRILIPIRIRITPPVISEGFL